MLMRQYSSHTCIDNRMVAPLKVAKLKVTNCMITVKKLHFTAYLWFVSNNKSEFYEVLELDYFSSGCGDFLKSSSCKQGRLQI